MATGVELYRWRRGESAARSPCLSRRRSGSRRGNRKRRLIPSRIQKYPICRDPAAEQQRAARIGQMQGPCGGWEEGKRRAAEPAPKPCGGVSGGREARSDKHNDPPQPSREKRSVLDVRKHSIRRSANSRLGVKGARRGLFGFGTKLMVDGWGCDGGEIRCRGAPAPSRWSETGGATTKEKERDVVLTGEG